MEAFTEYPATLFLIVANAAVSMFALLNPGFMKDNIFHVGPILEKRQYHRMLTSGFLHGGLLHLFVNMYVLFMFGAFIEAQLGPVRYLIVYFAALLGGSVWALLENRHEPDYRALGASGAVAGIILSVCLFAPFTWLVLFIIPMPAVVFGFLFIVASAILAQRKNKIIGHEAHLGGALAGILATIAVEPDALSIFSTQIAGFLNGGSL